MTVSGKMAIIEYKQNIFYPILLPPKNHSRDNSFNTYRKYTYRASQIGKISWHLCGSGQGQGPPGPGPPKDKDKDLTPKDQDKDKDLKYVLKDSLRTRTRTRTTARQIILIAHINLSNVQW